MFYIISTLAISILSFIVYKIVLFIRPSKEIQHIKTVPLTTYLLNLIKNESDTARNERLIISKLEEGNDICKLWLGKWFVMISDYTVIVDMLNKDITSKLKPKSFSKHSLTAKFLGDNVVDSDGHQWKRHRKVVNPYFKKGWKTDKFGDVCKKFLVELESETDSEGFEVIKLLRKLSLDALGLYVFDTDFNTIENESNNELATTYNYIITKLESVLLLIFPYFAKAFKSTKVLETKIDRFRILIQQLIDTKRSMLANGEVCDDLISTMLKCKDDEGNQMLTDTEIIDDTIVFFAAGHDTTAHTLSFILYYLAKHPDIQNKLRKEIFEIVELDSSATTDVKIPDLQHINQLQYLTAVIYEAMRINPVAGMMGRKLTQNYIVNNNLTLYKGQVLLLNLNRAMQDPKLFPNPDEFSPDRFLNLDGTVDKSKVKFNLGFGYGLRICLGQSFTLIEMKVTIAMLLQNFKIELPSNSIHSNRPVVKSLGITKIKDLKLKFTKL